MHVIVMSDRLRGTRSFRLQRLHMWILGSAMLGLLTAVGLAGYGLARGTPAQPAVPVAGTASKAQIDQLALNVGELQARLARLDAISARVSAKAGVPLPADNARAGRGGPAIPEPIAYTAEELAVLIDDLMRRIELASDQMLVLDAELLLRQASQGKLPMDRPVTRDSYLSSVFGTRIDPFNGKRARHEGLDFADDIGAPILAAESGVVIEVNSHPQYGNSLDIDHGNGLVTRYAHTSRVLVKKGAIVKRGQAIAEMGSTGRSTGPHLHFEVRKNGIPQNPMDYLSGRS